MATITLTFGSAIQDRIVNGLCGAYNYPYYQETGGTLNQNQYAKQMVIDFVKTTIKNYEAGTATAAVYTTTAANVESGIIII